MCRVRLVNFKCDSGDVLRVSYQSSYCLNSRFRGRSNTWSAWKEKRTGTATQARIWNRISASTFSQSPPPWWGVCLTVIGLIRVVITLGRAETLADDFLAGDALLFLISCLLSYWALRSRSVRRMHRLEKIADGIFILAMIGMVIICALITYTISAPARPGVG